MGTEEGREINSFSTKLSVSSTVHCILTFFSDCVSITCNAPLFCLFDARFCRGGHSLRYSTSSVMSRSDRNDVIMRDNKFNPVKTEIMSKTRWRNKRRRCDVPYARGYNPPTLKRRLEAIGKISNGEKEFEANGEFFSSIPPPTSIDDWLAQYNEKGQTYQQFLSRCPWLSTRKWKYSKAAFNSSGENIREKYPGAKIYLQPIGIFDTRDAPTFDNLAEYTRLFFCLPVEVLPEVMLEKEDDSTMYWIESAVMRSRVDKKAERKSPRSSKCRLELRHKTGNAAHIQLKCASVLTRLRQTLPDDALCLIGLTMLDLFDDDPDLFVAGLAAGQHRVGVFSFFRYNPTLSFSTEFWYEIKHSQDMMPVVEQKQTVLQRSCKLLVHEVCHLLGLDHCIWYSCLMNGSGHLSEDFSQPMTLCPVDLRKLHTLTGYNITARYEGLQKFYQKCGLKKEAEWVNKRLVSIAK